MNMAKLINRNLNIIIASLLMTMVSLSAFSWDSKSDEIGKNVELTTLQTYSASVVLSSRGGDAVSVLTSTNIANPYIPFYPGKGK